MSNSGLHRGSCALARHPATSSSMAFDRLRATANWLLDFALPPRCAGCGTITPDVHSFCADCWKTVEFLGNSGCSTCGLPLQATEQTTCGACLARPPRIARTRAAVAYGDLARGLAIRLKYGRKVAIARTMAHYMAPLVGDGGRPAIGAGAASSQPLVEPRVQSVRAGRSRAFAQARDRE